MYAVYMYP